MALPRMKKLASAQRMVVSARVKKTDRTSSHTDQEANLHVVMRVLFNLENQRIQCS